MFVKAINYTEEYVNCDFIKSISPGEGNIHKVRLISDELLTVECDRNVLSEIMGGSSRSTMEDFKKEFIKPQKEEILNDVSVEDMNLSIRTLGYH